MSSGPVLSFEDRKRKAASLLYAAYKSLTDGNTELKVALGAISSVLKLYSESVSRQPTETDQNLLTVKIEPLLVKVEPLLTEHELPSESVIDQLAQTETEPPSKAQSDPLEVKLQLYLLTMLRNLTRHPSAETSVLRKGWKRLAVEFKDPTKRARKKHVSASSSGVSLTLWVIVVFYLIFGMPSWLSIFPSGGSRDFFWAAVIVAVLLCVTISVLTRRTLLRVREMLWSIFIVELVLFGSIWFMTGLNPFDQINFLFILTWFLYMQLFTLVPWILSWGLVYWFWPPTKSELP